MLDLNELKKGSAIRSKSFDFTVLTPLFMHGWQETKVNDRGRAVSNPINAELRGSSIRGVLRYWWRSLQTEGQTTASLMQKEQALFGGSSAGNESGSRSPLLLKLSSRDQQSLQENKNSANICPHKSQNMRSLSLVPGRKLRIEMQVLKKDSQAYEPYENYCMFTFMLAGFGQRSRRGSGAIQIDDFNWTNVPAFREALQENVSSLRLEQEFNFQPQQKSCLLERTVKEYTYPRLMRVWIGEAFHSAEEARFKISEAGHTANPGKSTQMLGNVGRDRLASPLLCTVRRIGNDFYPLVSEVSNPHMAKPSYQVQRDIFLTHLGVTI